MIVLSVRSLFASEQTDSERISFGKNHEAAPRGLCTEAVTLRHGLKLTRGQIYT